MQQLKKRLSLPKIDLPTWKWPVRVSGKRTFPPLRIGDLEIKVPVVQGGMAVGISLSGLATAVAREGGVGIIAATGVGMLEDDYFQNGREANIRALTREIRTFRKNCDGVLGINIMVAVEDFDTLLDVCIREKVDIVFMGAGLPIKGIPVEALRKANIKAVPIVSSARAAGLIFNYWWKAYKDIPDAVVVEGPMAGGHLGFKAEQIDDPEFRLEKLIPQVKEALAPIEKTHGRKIPVIAAGGIFTGEDICRFFRLGASGVQMGTRFVATDECDADRKFKEAFVSARKEDVQIIASPVGLPGRALGGEFFSRLKDKAEGPTRCVWKCLKSCKAEKARYCISVALYSARKGDLKNGFAFAGANAFRVKGIVPVSRLIESLGAEYAKTMDEVTLRLKTEYEKAMKRISSLHKEYSQILDEALQKARRKYGRMVARQSDALKDEFEDILVRLAELKSEYLEHAEKLKRTVNQLSFCQTS